MSKGQFLRACKLSHMLKDGVVDQLYALRVYSEPHHPADKCVNTTIINGNTPLPQDAINLPMKRAKSADKLLGADNAVTGRDAIDGGLELEDFVRAMTRLARRLFPDDSPKIALEQVWFAA